MTTEKVEKTESLKEADKGHLHASEKEDTGSHMKCTSCGIKIEAEEKWVKFSCPKCGKHRIIRCDKCKRLMNVYECPKCGFLGP
jgi:predicted RNA-binding Zn-ribbon protein involved in translation (DUF1610 family)